MRYTLEDFRAELECIENEGVVDYVDVLRMLDALEETKQ